MRKNLRSKLAEMATVSVLGAVVGTVFSWYAPMSVAGWLVG